MAAYIHNRDRIGGGLSAQLGPLPVAIFSVSRGWRQDRPMSTRQGPSQALPGDVINQCIFVRGICVKKRLFLWPRVMTAAAGYHDPGKHGPEEEEAEGLLSVEGASSESQVSKYFDLHSMYSINSNNIRRTALCWFFSTICWK